MLKRHLRFAAVSLGVALALAGCGKKKQAPIPTPPAPLPARQPAPPPPPPSAPEQKPADRQPSVTPPAPTRHHTRPSPMPVQPAPAPAPPPAPTPAAPPVLGTILPPERRQTLNREIDRSLERARRNLSALAGKNPDATARQTARRVESLIQQAQTARASDLEASRSLAERAELLSRDLLQGTGR